MRRQRFIYTLPPQDDSILFADSDSASMISSPYSYPETIWSQIIAPEPEPFFPLCLYDYPFFQVPPNQFSNCGDLFLSPVLSNSLHSLDSTNFYNDELEGLDFAIPTTNMVPYGDGFNSVEYPNYGNTDNYICCLDNMPQEVLHRSPTVTDYGAVTILLRHLVRVDISADKAVYVTNPPASHVVSINGTGDKSCIIHANGRVFHDGPEIHMETLNRRAKISKRGIVFTSNDHCLAYLVDASGTKTTAEKFRDLTQDFSVEVFYNDVMTQDILFKECNKMRDESSYKNYWNGDEVWFIGGYRIKQDQRGDVKLTRNGGRQMIRSSPTSGQVSLKTFQTECSIGRYPNNYFVVRKGDKQVTASVGGFNVQNGSQKAGFNSSGKVVLL